MQEKQEIMSEINSADVIIFTIFGIATIALLFGFILYFVFGYRSKQRDNQILISQKTEIDHQKQIIENALMDLKATQNQLIQSEKLASLGELTAGIAHEIQNPLNFVNNFSEINLDIIKDLLTEIQNPKIDIDYIKELATDISENQAKINSHGSRASNIVRSMLEHSRQSSGIKLPTDINSLADEYLRLSYHGFRAKNKNFNSDFKTNFDLEIPKISIVAQDIGRVILNLINNAFYAVWQKSLLNSKETLSNSKYMPLVEVATKTIGNELFISITDNGTGMNEATKLKIFQPFFTTKPAGEGTGLGLSLAYDIITKGHAGKLLIESTEGEGTELTIVLPLK
jgi:two-component system NtrC family sensor kinase